MAHLFMLILKGSDHLHNYTRHLGRKRWECHSIVPTGQEQRSPNKTCIKLLKSAIFSTALSNYKRTEVVITLLLHSRNSNS
jgi:hypothetical protein